MTASEPEVSALLAPLATGEDRVIARLHTRLAAAAERDGVLDVAYRTLDTPVGTLLLAATAQGLVKVAYSAQDHERVLAELAAAVSPRILWAPQRLDEASHQLGEYFAGRRTLFELPLDFRLSSGFRRAVLAVLPGIGYGHTWSYAQVAAAAGNPKAVRAAGSACGANPLPIVVPCHRVVRADGSSGGYIGGPGVKCELLKLEAAA